MEESAVETLLLSAQFLQCVGVKGSELFPDLRGTRILDYNSESQRKTLAELCKHMSQPLLAKVLEEAEAKEATAKNFGYQQSAQTGK